MIMVIWILFYSTFVKSLIVNKQEDIFSFEKLTIDIINSSTITLKNLPQYFASKSCIISRYQIRIKELNNHKIRSLNIFGNRESMSIHGLLVDTHYSLRIILFTCQGKSKPSQWITFKTADRTLNIATIEDKNLAENSAPNEPTIMKLLSTQDSVFIQWISRPSNIVIRGYVVGYGEGVPDVNWQYLDANRNNITLKNLKKSTQYVISIRAFNNYGKGPVIYELVYTEDSPGSYKGVYFPEPINLKSKVMSSTTILLEWTDSSLQITHSKSSAFQTANDNRLYHVHCKSTNNNLPIKIESTKKTQVVINGLIPATQYEFKVKIIKDESQSVYSLPIYNETLEAVPSSPPRSVNVTVILIEKKLNIMKMYIQWRPPKYPNGNITEYQIQYTENVELPIENWRSLIVNLKTECFIETYISNFFIRVRAGTSLGYGPRSDIIKVFADSHILTEPFLNVYNSTNALNEFEIISKDNDEKLITLSNSLYFDDSFEADETSDIPQIYSNKRKREPNINFSENNNRTTKIVIQKILHIQVAAFITWPDVPNINNRHNKIAYYKIRLKKLELKKNTELIKWKTVILYKNVFMVDNLTIASKYLIQIIYIFVNGEEYFSQEEEFIIK